MPFTALRDDNHFLPHEVAASDTLTCPVCENPLTVVKEHFRKKSFIARHFRHLSATECEGESGDHYRMKAIAHSKLTVTYPDSEVTIETPVEDRRPDILVNFPEPRHPYGKGIAVEVQHQNNSKDITQTDSDYYNLGYSVLWLSSQNYSGYDVNITHIQPVWPLAIPPLRGYDGLDWPVVPPSNKVSLPVRLPREFYTEHKADFEEAFLRGKRRMSPSSGWKTIEHVWLSQPHQSLKRSLSVIENFQGSRYLKLSKGRKDRKPEFQTVLLADSMNNRMAAISSFFESFSPESFSLGDWERVESWWMTEFENPVTAWLEVGTTPKNEVYLKLATKENGETEFLKTTFGFSSYIGEELSEFFAACERIMRLEY